MSLSVQQAVEAYLLPVVQTAVSAAEKFIPGVLPPPVGALLAGALALPGVQAEIAKLEVAGVDEAAILAGKGVEALEKLVLDHTHGKIHDWLSGVFASANGFQLNMTQDDAALMAKLTMAGKYSEALKIGAKALGLA